MTFHHKVLRITAFLSAVALLYTSEASGHSVPEAAWCAPTGTVQSLHVLQYLRRLATGTDSSAILARAAIDMQPIAQSEVVMITDEAICRRASAALDSFFFVAPESASVFLVRLGSRYAIHPPGYRVESFGYMIHTDSAFNKLAVTSY